MINKGQIYSIKFQQSSYRSEFGVIVCSQVAGIITFTKVFWQDQEIINKNNITYTDNKRIIKLRTKRKHCSMTDANDHKCGPDADIDQR